MTTIMPLDRGPRMPRESARQWAQQIIQQMRPLSHRIEVAGSVRRRENTAGDLNFVCLPKDRAAFRARVLETKPSVLADNRDVLAVRLKNGVIIDFWFSEAVRQSTRLCVGGTNFGSLLLFRTGSVRHSQWLQQRAVRLGMRWNPAFGLYRERQLIAADTEDEIYQALGVQFVEPEARAANPSGLQAA